MKRLSRKLLQVLVFLIAAAGFSADNVLAQTALDDSIHIFFSAGCADCWPYVEDVLLPSLETAGVTAPARIHDYTSPDERARLMEMADGLGIPRSIADSLYAFVPHEHHTLVILGHVPPELVGQALRSPNLPQRLILWQPEMHGEPEEYRLWAWSGEVSVFDIDTPFEEALGSALSALGPLPVGLANLNQLLPAVVVTGLLDSVNPCAFAVILLLVAFLYTLRQSRQRVLQLGLIYIAMIFIVYFAIGLGILRAVRLSSEPHFVARAGSWLLIGLGLINVLEVRFPNFPIKLHIPHRAMGTINQLIRQASVPATMGVGLLTGLCTFPCSGGVYVSILTLLNAKTTLAWGVAYLGLYNLLFVLPLLVIVFAAGNRVVAKRWASWERHQSRWIRLAFGFSMMALGVIMLVFVI